MASVEKQFIDEFSRRAIDNAEQLQQFDNRLRRVEQYLGLCDKRFMCFRCKDYTGRPQYHDFGKTLYCDKCDKLHCSKHYCDHLCRFVEQIKK